MITTPRHLIAPEWANDLISKDFVIIDTETTGLDDPHPIQVSIIDSTGNTLFNELIRPPASVEINQRATETHGITMDDLKDKPTLPDVWSRIDAACSGKVIVAYNAKFDRRVLENALTFHKITFPSWLVQDWECAMLQYSEYAGEWNAKEGSWKWQKLTTAAFQLGVEVCNAHDALGDVVMTLGVIRALASMHPKGQRLIGPHLVVRFISGKIDIYTFATAETRREAMVTIWTGMKDKSPAYFTSKTGSHILATINIERIDVGD